MDRLVLVARLKPDARERARELIAAKPDPTEVDATFTRLGIFLAQDEIVFFFEGEDADESMRMILNDPARSAAIAPWLPLFDGPLQGAHEAYFWEQEHRPNL
jgi:hypothetical protein